MSSEAPYSENVASAVSASSAANAIRAASEAAYILKDSTQESAQEDALEEAALTEAAMQDDAIADDKIDDTDEASGNPVAVPASPMKVIPSKPPPAPVSPSRARQNQTQPPVTVRSIQAPSTPPKPASAPVRPSQSETSNPVRVGISVPAEPAVSMQSPHALPRSHLRGPAARSQPESKHIAPASSLDSHSSSIAAQDALGMGGMEKALTDLVLGKASFGATPFGNSVSQISKLIEDDMMPKVLAAHTANQRELEKLMDEVHDCAMTKNISVQKADTKKTMYLKMSPLHKTCRSGEAGKYTEKTECLGELRDKRGLMKLKCKEFAFVYKKYGDQNSNRQIVKKGGSEHTESYLKRITSTVCGRYPPGGMGGGGKDGFLDVYMRAKEACNHATQAYKFQYKKCSRIIKEYKAKRKSCDNIQDQMDDAACKRAVGMKDACETYAECYYDKRKVYVDTEKMVKVEEKDRQAEWRGLKRMQCLMKSFADGKVTAAEVEECKKGTYDVGHLVIKYPFLPKLVTCKVPDRYPTTAQYKLVEFAPLPTMAKGKEDANECTGVVEIPITPNKGSPKTCKCERMTLNGPFSPGPLVRCSNCMDIRRSQDVNSCPWGTKLFSPQSASDWQTVFSSVGPLEDPYFVVDITRPQKGCGGCTRKPMNSGTGGQAYYWHTSDGSPWWLRSNTFKEPNGNYHANCYMAVFKPWNANSLRFDDDGCKFHSKSYYCQLKQISTTPKKGSPASCQCEKLALTGTYSAGALIKCEGCWRVSKSTQKNSCPVGTKLFSPVSNKDWKTVLASAKPLRSPNWIIDITRPQNGCGGCTKYPMNSHQPAQGTWRTSDGSAWWLRSTRYSEPSGDYYANCYMDLWKIPANENSVVFNDHRCKYHSNAYYCQPVKRRR